jgi:hypothetical protein
MSTLRHAHPHENVYVYLQEARLGLELLDGIDVVVDQAEAGGVSTAKHYHDHQSERHSNRNKQIKTPKRKTVEMESVSDL